MCLFVLVHLYEFICLTGKITQIVSIFNHYVGYRRMSLSCHLMKQRTEKVLKSTEL